MQISEGEHVFLGLEKEAGSPSEGVGQAFARAEGGGLVVSHQAVIEVLVVETFLTSGRQLSPHSGVLVDELGGPQSVDGRGLVRDDPVDQPDPLPPGLAGLELLHVELHVLVGLLQLNRYFIYSPSP